MLWLGLSIVTSRSSIKTAGWIKLVLGTQAPSAYPARCWKGILISPKIRVLPSRALFQTPIFLLFCRSMSIVASVVNLVRPTTVASLPHRTSTFVYNTMGVTQRVARVRLRQPRLVKLKELCLLHTVLILPAPSQVEKEAFKQCGTKIQGRTGARTMGLALSPQMP